MPTQQNITNQMIQELAVTLPTLDTSIGSPIRSILDVVAEVVSEQTADQYLINYQYDVFSKTGTDLDAFCQVFGISRFAAKRAVGFITFSRTTATNQDLVFGVGNQVSDGGNPPNIFTTIIPAVMPAGTNSVTIPIQASIAGTQGNVAANTITTKVSPLAGVAIVTNLNGLTGGADAESDIQLQNRFVATVLRALTGTTPMFIASALEDPSVTTVNVIGATETFTEQIQIINHIGVSSVQDLAYLYNNNTYFGLDLNNGPLFSPGAQYTLTSEVIPNPIAPAYTTSSGGGSIPTTTPIYAMTVTTFAGETALGLPLNATVPSSDKAHVTWSAPGTAYDADIIAYNLYRDDGSGFHLIASVNNATFLYIDDGTEPLGAEPPVYNTTSTPILRSLDFTNVPDGIYQLQYNYLSDASRNDPVNNITNRIDIYVNGIRPIEAFQDIVYTNGFVFNDSDGVTIEDIPTSKNIQLFQRIDGTQPEVGNYFTPFAFCPVIDMLDNANGIPLSPAHIGSTTWIEGVNYWVVNDISQFGGSSVSRSGIEWASPGPTNLTPITVHYEFNQVPTSVQQNVEEWRLVTTDCSVHQAIQKYLDMYLAVILSAGVTPTNMLPQIETAISNYISSVTFDGVVQVSQLLAAVQGVQGVVACRFLTSADGYRQDTATYSSSSSTITDTSIRDKDFGSPVIDTATGNIPPDSFVGEVTSGASFVLVNPEGDPVLPLGSGTSVDIGTHLTLFGTGPHNGSSAAGFYAIQSVNPATDAVLETFATTLGSPLRAVDVYLNDATLATLNNVYIIPMAQNTFGAV